MTKEEILAFKPGRELNIAVAEVIMGATFVEDKNLGDLEVHPGSIYGPLEPYSENIQSAWLVMNRLKGLNPKVAFNIYSHKWEAAFSSKEASFSCPIAAAATAPEAICKAALLAMLEVKHI